MAKRKKTKRFSIYLILPLIIILFACYAHIREWIEPYFEIDNDIEVKGTETMTPQQKNKPTPTYMPESMIGEKNLYRITANEYLSLRDAPSREGNRLAKLPAGEVVQLLERVECYYKVQADTLTGYLLAGYLEPIEKDAVLESLQIVDTTKQNYSYDEMVEDIDELSKKYGDYMTVETLGSSYDGREIKVIVLGGSDASRDVLIHAGIHGREYMTVMLVMKQLEYYLSMKSQGLDKPWLNDVRFHIVPMLNPDGVMIAQLGPDAIQDDDLRKGLKAIRKNDKKRGIKLEEDEYYAQWKDNARGVDINLNFDANWENIELSKKPSYSKYKGESIESEIETKAIVEYTKKYELDATISYHAYGSGYYWYFGQTGKLEQDTREFGKAIENVSGYLSLSHADGATNGGGGYKDWAIESLGIPSLTIEIGSTPCPLMMREWPTVWERNKEVWRATGNWVLNK